MTDDSDTSNSRKRRALLIIGGLIGLILLSMIFLSVGNYIPTNGSDDPVPNETPTPTTTEEPNDTSTPTPEPVYIEQQELPVECSSDEPKFFVKLPNMQDHYPDTESSIQYHFVLCEQYENGDGLWLNNTTITSPEMNFSECTTSGNTKVFGFDRGNNLSGAMDDDSLLEHQAGSNLSRNSFFVEYYNWNAISNSPPYFEYNDEFILAQGEGSNDGPCMQTPDEPGWYRSSIEITGTVADNGTEENNEDSRPTSNAKNVSMTVYSNYYYVCECDSYEEAVRTLGAPPNKENKK